MNRFFAYEEYGAKYEIMLKDVTLTYRAQPQWNTFETGLEALATTLASIDTQYNVSKKALTIGDLLVKVISLIYDKLILTNSGNSHSNVSASIHFYLGTF